MTHFVLRYEHIVVSHMKRGVKLLQGRYFSSLNRGESRAALCGRYIWSLNLIVRFYDRHQQSPRYFSWVSQSPLERNLAPTVSSTYPPYPNFIMSRRSSESSLAQGNFDLH